MFFLQKVGNTRAYMKGRHLAFAEVARGSACAGGRAGVLALVPLPMFQTELAPLPPVLPGRKGVARRHVDDEAYWQTQEKQRFFTHRQRQRRLQLRERRALACSFSTQTSGPTL